MKKTDLVLNELVDEAIYIIRETAANFQNPVILYSIGKDSSVVLDLCLRAFRPGKMPFSLLHVDTTWNFRDMINFREMIRNKYDLKLVVHRNEEGVRKNVNPFGHTPSEYTRIMATEALKEALDKYAFDVALGGSRRDEEKSRAKERIISIREMGHRWNPRNQRPELWNSYNTRLSEGQTARVFPISNFTELDIWKYIKKFSVDICNLYFSANRPTVQRGKQLLVIDDGRFEFVAGDKVVNRNVRFRTLGCYPLTAAVESKAVDLDSVIEEVYQTRLSERSTRLIDGLNEDSMESKKIEGYF